MHAFMIFMSCICVFDYASLQMYYAHALFSAIIIYVFVRLFISVVQVIQVSLYVFMHVMFDCEILLTNRLT